MENGKPVTPFTEIRGLYVRGDEHKQKPPYKIADSWMKARATLNPTTPYNFVSTNDIVGGNSGSPVINVKGELVGLDLRRQHPVAARVFRLRRGGESRGVGGFARHARSAATVYKAELDRGRAHGRQRRRQPRCRELAALSEDCVLVSAQPESKGLPTTRPAARLGQPADRRRHRSRLSAASRLHHQVLGGPPDRPRHRRRRGGRDQQRR